MQTQKCLDPCEGKATTEALMAVTKPPKDQKVRKREICICCNGKHWSDECRKFPTVAVRKIKGNSFICLKPGHHQRDCKTNKVCVHVFALTNSQRNPNCKHGDWTHINHYHSREYLASFCRASTNADSHRWSRRSTKQTIRKQTIRFLLDTGSQRTNITEELAGKLQLVIKGSETLTVYTFSTSKPRQR